MLIYDQHQEHQERISIRAGRRHRLRAALDRNRTRPRTIPRRTEPPRRRAGEKL